MRLRDSMSSFERTHLLEALEEAAGKRQPRRRKTRLPRNTLRAIESRGLACRITAAHRNRSRILETRCRHVQSVFT